MLRDILEIHIYWGKTKRNKLNNDCDAIQYKTTTTTTTSSSSLKSHKNEMGKVDPSKVCKPGNK